MKGTAQLIVRNLPSELVTQLKERATAHGRSAEAEHREILRAALAGGGPRRSLKKILLSMPGEEIEDEMFERPLERPRRTPL